MIDKWIKEVVVLIVLRWLGDCAILHRRELKAGLRSVIDPSTAANRGLDIVHRVVLLDRSTKLAGQTRLAVDHVANLRYR